MLVTRGLLSIYISYLWQYGGYVGNKRVITVLYPICGNLEVMLVTRRLLSCYISYLWQYGSYVGNKRVITVLYLLFVVIWRLCL
jgi:hypothetical protein